jgi:hypothetical protein
MGGWVDAIQDNRDMGQEFRDNVEGACEHKLSAGEFVQDLQRNRGILPHTVQRMNSIVASFSFTRFKLMAMADSPIMIVPM